MSPSRVPGRRGRRLLTPRALAVALVLLLLLDLALRLPAAQWFPRDFRFPAVTTAGFDEYVEYMRTRPGVRVAVVGDSIVQGLFADQSQTMPAVLDRLYAEQRRPVRAFNFGISVAHATDLFGVVSRISSEKAADVLVVNFNYPFFLEPVSGAVPYTGVRYPQLYKGVRSWAPFERDPTVMSYTEAPDRRTLPQKLRDVLASSWKLYGSRDAYAAALLGQGAPQWVQQEYALAVSGPPKQVKKMQAADFETAKLKAIWQGNAFDDTNYQLRYFRMLLQKARHDGLAVVVVAGPANLPVLEARGILSRVEYTRNLDYVRGVAAAEGATFVDVTDRIPPEDIVDSVHPMPAGYAIMAEAAKEGLEPVVSRLEHARGGR